MILSLRRFVASLSSDLRWISLAIFLSGLAEGLSINFHTLYVEFLGAKPEQIGATFAIAGAATIFVYIPTGYLADRGRRKPIILTAWVSTIVTFAWLALAPDWRWAVPGFMLYTLGSFARPAFSAHIAATDRSGNVNRAFALTSLSWSIGSIFAPAAGGWIGEHFGLRAVFACSGVVYFFSTLALLRLTDQPPATRHSREVRLSRLLSDRHYLWQVGVIMLIMFSLYLGIVLAPNYLQEVKKLSVQQIGELGTVSSLGLMAFTVWLGRLPAERRTPLMLVQLAALIMLAMILNSPIAMGGGLPLIFVAAYLFRGGADAVWTPISSRLSLWVPPDILSLGFSLRDTAVRIALTIAPLAAGQLYALNPAYPLYAGMAAVGLTMLLTLTLPRRRPQALTQAPAPGTP
jgi:DHA1 family multidrug resistance protein-like MFS transporter